MSRTRWTGVLLACGVAMSAGCGGPEPAAPAGPRSAADAAVPAGPAGGGAGGDRAAADGPRGAAEWRTAGCAAAAARPGPGPMPVTAPALAAVMGRIEQDGPSRFPDSFAGLEVDQVRNRTVVYRVPSAAFDAYVRQVAGDACVVVRDAAHPAGRLDALRERLTADLDHWASAGVRINSVGARHDGSGVEVGVEDVAAARARLAERYGADAPLIVTHQGPIAPLSGGAG